MVKTIKSRLSYIWDIFGDIVNSLLIDRISEYQYRKTVNVNTAFVHMNNDAWFNYFWDTLSEELMKADKTILIRNKNILNDADERILYLLSQEISISGYEETDDEYSNQNSPYSFTLGPETSEIIFDGKRHTFKTKCAHAYLYVLMSKENTEISYQKLYELVNKSNGKNNKMESLIEQVYYFISSNDDSKNSYDLKKIENNEVVRFQKSIDKSYMSKGIPGLTNELKIFEQERENLSKGKSINQTHNDNTETLEKLNGGIEILKKYISDKKLNTNMDPQLKKISNNVGKQINILKKDLSQNINIDFNSSITCQKGMCKFINSDISIKWYLKIKKDYNK